MTPSNDIERHDLPGALRERYSPVERLARGRLSTVMRATCGDSGREVAIKALHEHLVEQEPVRRRLRHEFKVVRRLDHPAIVRVEELVDEDRALALVMEYADGESVRELVRRKGALRWERASDIVEQICDAIDHAHGRGIWHRDLSAEHVLIGGDGDVRLVGFGMARVDELVAMTMHTRTLGALEAAAPERVLGLEYDGRADIYSIGAVAWEMVCGHPPVEGSFSDAYRGAQDGVDIDELPASLPEDAHYVLERALAADPGTRFATASQMRRALEDDGDARRREEWAIAEVDRCSSCETPVVYGIDRCIECGREFERLIRRPGEGQWAILFNPEYQRKRRPAHQNVDSEGGHFWIALRASRRRTHHTEVEEVWRMDEEKFDGLMELLGRYDDTAPFADGRWEYSFPPYVLTAGLVRDDAERISGHLEGLEIEHSICRVPAADTPSKGRAAVNAGMLLIVPALAAMGLVGYQAAVAIPWLATAMAAGVSGPWLSLRLIRERAEVEEVDRSTGTVRDLPLLIPPEDLTSLGRVLGDAVVPQKTARLLGELERETLRDEVLELLLLAMECGYGEETPVDELRGLVDEILVAARALDEVSSALATESTAELIEEVQRVEARRGGEELSGEADALRSERGALLDALDRRDDLEYRRAVLRAKLQQVRGGLLELRFAQSGADIGGGELRRSLDELRIGLETRAEIEALVGEGAG